ncbi:PPC domain-containing protein [Oscillatoria laete-virens NRMC-F 0139]|nr:PPC domain-containing protein [Oscillatoria laete-virens]MDL5055639.1 PPC domain-containing protein [Oscillatoria laete-virens NRMC-F 0139]
MLKRKFILFAVLALLLAALPMAASAQEATEAPEAPAAEPVAIAVGDSVDGELTADAPEAFFTFEGEAGQAVTITLVSEDFDTFLVLLDVDGNELDTDDDSAGRLDSQIRGITLPANGTYTIIATSYSAYRGTGQATGAFTLSLDAFEVRRIEYSQSINAELTSSELSQSFVFTGSAGDVVIITHVSDAFDSYLYLDGPDGRELTYNDDSAGNLDSLIGPYELPQTGEYTIRATSYSRNSTGPYTLTLQRAQLVTIEYGEEVTAELEPGGVLYFQFEGRTGDVIDIYVEGQPDTFIQLNDVYNYQLISDEDSGPGRNPEIMDYVLNNTGTYTLLLRSNVGDSGEVTLRVVRGELPTLNDGPQTLSFNSNATQRTISFQPAAGVSYTLSVELLSGGGFGGTTSPSIDVRQGDLSSTYVSASNVTALSASFTSNSTDEIIISVSEYSYTNTSLRVSITANE